MLIPTFPLKITFLIENSLSQFLYHGTTDGRVDMFQEKLLPLRLLNLREISPEDLNNSAYITFKNPQVQDGDATVKLKA